MCVSAVVCLIIDGQHLKEQATTQIWTFRCRILSKGIFFSFLPFSFFFRLLSPRPAFLVCGPSLCPTSPFLPPLRRAGAWALALNYDPACNQSYPWALPSSQATDSSSLLPSPFPTSSSCSVFVPLFFFPFPSCWIQNGHAGCWRGAAQRQRRVNTASAAEQQAQGPPASHSPGPRPYPSICEMTLNWWVNDGVNLSGQDSLALELVEDKQTAQIQAIYLPNLFFSLLLFSSHIVWICGGPALLLHINVIQSILKLETTLSNRKSLKD